MVESNSILLKKFSKVLDDKDLRAKIIYNSVLIGSYNARKDYLREEKRDPFESFGIGRITAKVYEAEKIAEKLSSVLKEFENEKGDKKGKKVLENLEKEISNIDTDEIIKEGIFYKLQRLRKYGCEIGRRLENNLSERKTGEKDLKKEFLIEESRISGILSEKIEDLERHWRE